VDDRGFCRRIENNSTAKQRLTRTMAFNDLLKKHGKPQSVETLC